ncbi:MAG: DUF6159 family protein [Gammaproteobacteria bacterium]
MGFFDRLKFGWNLGTTSLGVVFRDKTLMLFPILSAICGLLLGAVFAFGIGPEEIVAQMHAVETAADVPPLYYAVGFALYFALAFVAVYFNVALLGAAQQSVAGKDTTVGDGLAVANQHLGKIAAWAVISGTVGVLLGSLENNEKVGRMVRAILGFGWAIITYFVVPVMIFENQSPGAAIARSTGLMKQTWGENVGAQFGVGIVSFLLMLGHIVVCLLGAALIPYAEFVLIPALAIGIPVIVLATMAAKAVLAVGLYQFATNQGGPSAFNPEQLRAAFR